MIKTSELRIGNWVKTGKHITPESYHEVRSLDSTGINIHDTYEGYTTLYEDDDIDPIPITPEWLEKFGFKRWYSTGPYWLGLKHGYLEVYDGDVFFSIEVNDLSYDLNSSEIKSIHQLQNLYFALTGQEIPQ